MILLILTLMLVLTAAPLAAAEDQVVANTQNAKDLTSYLKLNATNHNKMANRVLSAKIGEAETFTPYERFYAYWDTARVTPGYLCIQWNVLPIDVELLQMDSSGAILSHRQVGLEYDTIEKLLPEAQKVAFITGRSGMEIIRLALYSDGVLPEPFVAWKPTPEHLDYLIVSTHPDDDTLFMGGVIPLYGVDKGYVGTVAYVTTPGRKRVQEALLGAWTMGTHYMPIFLDYSDIADVAKYKTAYAYRFLPESVTLTLVRMFRQYRPLVVFTHDVNGEYGHWQHKIVSASVIEASRLAGDESYDPISLTQYGAWQVQKCYVHLYEEDQLVLDVNTPLASLGGKTALAVAKEAFLRHTSQQGRGQWVQTDTDKYPLSRFGMAYGAVEAGTDVFDNINPQLLSTAPAAATETEPEPTPAENQ